MKILAEKKKELEELLKELESSDNTTLQKKAKTYREEFSTLNTSKNQTLLLIDSAQLLKDLKAARIKIANLEYEKITFNTLIVLVDTIAVLKNQKDAAKKDKKIKPDDLVNIELEWDNLLSTLNSLDDKLIVGATDEIEKLLKLDNDENREKAASKFKETKKAYEVIKNIYTLCEKGVPSKDGDYKTLEALVKEEKNKVRVDSEGKEMEKVNFELKLLHYKKKINFEKKQEIIDKIVEETKVSFEELVNDRGDVKRFKNKLTATLEEKVKSELKQLDKILKKEEKRGDESDLTLPVYFKKVNENGVTGWIIDIEKTKAPKKKEQKGEAVLSYTPEVAFVPKPVLSGDVFVSELQYLIPITRSAFKHKTVNWLKLTGTLATTAANVYTGIEGQKPTVTIGGTNETTTTTTGGVSTTTTEETTTETTTGGKKYDAGKITKDLGTLIDGIDKSVTEETEGETTDSIAWKLVFKYNTKTKTAEISATSHGDLKNIEYKKVHRYHSNMEEASDLFKMNASKI